MSPGLSQTVDVCVHKVQLYSLLFTLCTDSPRRPHSLRPQGFHTLQRLRNAYTQGRQPGSPVPPAGSHYLTSMGRVGGERPLNCTSGASVLRSSSLRPSPSLHSEARELCTVAAAAAACPSPLCTLGRSLLGWRCRCRPHPRPSSAPSLPSGECRRAGGLPRL